MNNEIKMNILVIGPSGAGKSTLIKAISGKKVKTGIGEGQTKNIEIFESDIWPFKLIDTKGFEYNFFERLKTFNQVKKFTKSQVKSADDSGIDAIWYCVDGMSGRVFADNIKSMSNSIKEWKNVPIYVVITKSIIESNIQGNVDAVKTAFEKFPNLNLKEIIPVVSEEYVLNEDDVITPFGLEELCSKTLDCYDESKSISKENKSTMILKQKRILSQSIVSGCTAAGFGVGSIPIPSSPILMPIETGMIQSILKVYGINAEKNVLITMVGTGVVSSIGKGLAEFAIKMIPGANIIYGVVAAVIIAALGETTALVGEQAYLGNIDRNNMEEIMNKISDGVKDNALIDSLKKYITDNKDKLDGKSAKEIYELIVKEANYKK